MKLTALLPALSLLVLASTAAADPPAAAPAQEAPAASPRERFAGTYSYVGGDKQKAAIEAAIEKAIDGMFFATKPIARSRLKDKTQIRNPVGFAFGGGNITIKMGGVADATSKDDGSPAQYKSGSDTVKLTQKFAGDNQIVQVFAADDGTRTNVYTLSADGKTLTVSITLTSSKLSAPVKYALTYRKS